MWHSKKQKGVSISSIEIEYKIITHTACNIIWVQSLLCEMDLLRLNLNNI